MYLLLVFLSITGSCLSGLFGRYLGSLGASIITTSCLFLSFLISLFAFYEVSLVGCFVYIKLSPWINSEVLNVDWGFMFDIFIVPMCVSPTTKSKIYNFCIGHILTPYHNIKNQKYYLYFLMLHFLFSVMLLIYSLPIFLAVSAIFTVGFIISNRITLQYVFFINFILCSIWVFLFLVYSSMLVNEPTIPIYSGDSLTLNYEVVFVIHIVYSPRCPSLLSSLFVQTLWFLLDLEPIIGFYPIIYFF